MISMKVFEKESGHRQMQGPRPEVSALERLRQEDGREESNLDYKHKPCKREKGG